MGELPDHLQESARRRSERSRRAVEDVLQRMAAQPADYPKVTVALVAQEAVVSKGWLYKQEEYIIAIDRLRDAAPRGTGPVRPKRERASDASLMARIEVLNQLVGELQQENAELRATFEQRLADRWEGA